MVKQILVCKGMNYKGNLRKISAIRPTTHVYGNEELNNSKFKIITVDISEEDLDKWRNGNKKCVDISKDTLEEVPTGLVYWSKLENDNDIIKPEIGPEGTVVGSPTYVDAKFKKGMYVNDFEGYRIVTTGLYTTNLGCIEFWYVPMYASYDNVSHGIFGEAGSGAPVGDYIFMMKDSDNQLYSAIFRGPWHYSSGACPSWSAGDKVHIALVWDSNGFIIDETIYYQAVFVNNVFLAGDTDSTFTYNWMSPSGLKIGYMDNNSPAADGIIDNLKIYDYAKTDFSDKDIEG